MFHLKKISMMNLLTITAAVVMSMCMNTAAEKENVFYYNTEMEGDKVVAKYVYKQVSVPDASSAYLVLEPRRKYDYGYDAQDRLLVRVTHRWDGRRWHPDSRLEYLYTDSGYTVSLSYWDKGKRCFMSPVSKTTYTDMPEPGAVEVSTYERCGEEWVQTSHLQAQAKDSVAS